MKKKSPTYRIIWLPLIIEAIGKLAAIAGKMLPNVALKLAIFSPKSHIYIRSFVISAKNPNSVGESMIFFAL